MTSKPGEIVARATFPGIDMGDERITRLSLAGDALQATFPTAASDMRTKDILLWLTFTSTGPMPIEPVHPSKLVRRFAQVQARGFHVLDETGKPLVVLGAPKPGYFWAAIENGENKRVLVVQIEEPVTPKATA